MSDIALPGLARRRSAPPATKRTGYRHALAAEVLHDPTAIEALHDEWARLIGLQSGPVPFQSPDFLATWARHFTGCRGRKLALVVVRHAGRAILLWPLMLERRGLLTVALGAGAPITQYDEILLDPDHDAADALAAASDALAASDRPDLVHLERVRADGPLRRALQVAPMSWAEGAPYTDLSQGLAGVLAGMKPRVARTQKKRVRKFEKSGEARVAIAETPEEARAWVAEALELKHEWLRSTGRVSRAFTQPETTSCLAELAETLTHPDASPRLVVSRLTLDGETAAIEAAFCQASRYHLYLGAFSPDLSKLGPGNVLTQAMVDWCAARGFDRYDMMAPRSRYKGEWQSGEVAVLDFALPFTTSGRAYAEIVLKRLGPALRNAFYRLPTSLRVAVAGLSLRM